MSNSVRSFRPQARMWLIARSTLELEFEITKAFGACLDRNRAAVSATFGARVRWRFTTVIESSLLELLFKVVNYGNNLRFRSGELNHVSAFDVFNSLVPY